MSYDRVGAEELKVVLCDPSIQKDPDLYLNAVKKVVASMTVGIDVSCLFTDMIKAGNTEQLLQKKLVYLYLGYYAVSNSDLALMAVNTLKKDFEDHNALIRGLALRTLCSLRFTEVVLYLPEVVHHGLSDSNPYVRKTAVMGVVKLFHVDPTVVDEMNFVDVLYQMLRDRDPQVVTNCIAALSEILAGEGGMVVNTKIAHYLLNRFSEFSEWGQCQVLDLLMCYQIAVKDDIFDILNILDPKLKSSNSGVVLGTIRLFLHFTKDMPELQDDVCQRIRSPTLTFACFDYVELAYIYLMHAQLMMAIFPLMWRYNYQSFYCRHTDPLHVKVKKVEILADACMFENASQVTNELSAYISDRSCIVARKAIHALSRIAQRIPAKANACVDKILALLTQQEDHTRAEALVSLTSILRKFDMMESILPKLPPSSVLADSGGKASLIWILGEYGEDLPNTPYVLEELAGSIAEESSSEVRLQLLSAIMKMFFKRPPECQEMLGRLLEHTIEEDSDMDVRDRALLYYRLLKMDVKTAKKVVCGLPKIVDEISPLREKVSLLPEFNTLSVLFEQRSAEFVLQQLPYIISEGSVSRGGAEVNFEVDRTGGLITCSTERGKCPRVDSPPVISLNPEPVLSPADFESKWKAWTTERELHIHLERLLPQKEFIETLASHHIINMAASPPQHKLGKYFFYAQHSSTCHFFLVEVIVVIKNSMLSFTLKCENPKQVSNFTRHFLRAQYLSGETTPLLGHWTCSDIPTGMSSVQGVVYHNKLYLGGHTSSAKADSMLYAYCPDIDIWKVFPPCPLKWFGMAVWRDQLILLGGKEANSKKSAITNKLVVWEDGKWVYSLPPMLIARVSPLVVVHENHLALAGGGHLGRSVEVLESSTMQWCRVSSLPINCFPHLSTVCGDHLYLLHPETGRILQAHVPTFVRQKEEYPITDSSSFASKDESMSSETRDIIEAGSMWRQLPRPPVVPLRLTTVGGYIVVFSHGNRKEDLAVDGYFPETNSWCLMGRLPATMSSAACISSPEKQLYIAGGDSINPQFSQKLYQATLTLTT